MNMNSHGPLQRIGYVSLVAVLAAMAVAPAILKVVGAGWVAAPAFGWSLVAAALLGACLLMALKRPASEPALVATLPLLASTALVLTIVAFLLSPEGVQRMAPILGVTLALLGWWLVADVCGSCLNAAYCNASSYGELQHRLTEIDAILKDAQLADATARAPLQGAWLKAAQEQSAAIKAEFGDAGQPDLKWVLATGYISQWKRLHCAEESLLEVLPEQQVIAAAIGDELRLTGSKVESRDDLLRKLRQAVTILDPSARSFLKFAEGQDGTAHGLGVSAPPPAPVAATVGTPPTVPSDGVGTATKAPVAAAPAADLPAVSKPGEVASPVALLDAINVMIATAQRGGSEGAETSPHGNGGGAATALVAPKQTARSVLRVVRSAINEYEDDRYDGLVVARNLTWRTSTYTGATAFLLFAVAVFAGATRPAVVGAITFYLVGAIVGLLVRLRGEMSQEQDVSDYGLSNARLYAMPLFCGLAAVGGVLLMAMLPAAAGALTPLATTGNAGAGAGLIGTLPKIFDLGQNLQGVLVSALFGMTPELLFSRLQQLSEKYKTEIKAVGSAQKATP